MSSQVTLHAKQAEAKALQDQFAEFLASGGQIDRPASHNSKAQPFCPTQCAKPKAVYQPKTPPTRVAKRLPLFERGENHRANIVDFMRQSGQSVTVADIAKHMGMDDNATRWHITILCDDGKIRANGKRRYARLYEVVK